MFRFVLLIALVGCNGGEPKDLGQDDDDDDDVTDGDDDDVIGEDDDDDDDDDSAGSFSMSDLAYVGAFRITDGTFGNSDINYAVGTLAYNPDNHSLFIVGHSHQSSVAEFPIPTPGTQADVVDLPLTGDPLQPFTDVLGTAGNPESLDKVTGMYVVDGDLIINAEQWYDAAGDNDDTTVVVPGGDLTAAMNGWFELSGRAQAAGYMGPIPAAWQSDFGAEHFTGWSSVYSIISRYSLGPSLWTFDPEDMTAGDAASSPAVTATAFLNYAYHEQHLSDRATEWEAQGVAGPFPPSDPLWNPLSTGVYAFFVPGTDAFVVIGSTAGLSSGMGYKAEQSNGNVCGGPCAYEPDDYYNYYWIYDVDDILVASEVYDPIPVDYGIWDVPYDEAGSHEIIGGTLDPDSGTLYVALANAGQVGTYDRPPLIVTFELP